MKKLFNVLSVVAALLILLVIALTQADRVRFSNDCDAACAERGYGTSRVQDNRCFCEVVP